METYINNKWYPAYAIRKWATPEDIINKPFDTYEEALEYAQSFLCDDDSCRVFLRLQNKWIAEFYEFGEDANTRKRDIYTGEGSSPVWVHIEKVVHNCEKCPLIYWAQEMNATIPVCSQCGEIINDPKKGILPMCPFKKHPKSAEEIVLDTVENATKELSENQKLRNKIALEIANEVRKRRRENRNND